MTTKITVEEVNRYLTDLFPLNRSITGPDNRRTLNILQNLAPLEIIEYPSGLSVYDWILPEEWEVHEAWIKDADGDVLVDFRWSNLHLVSYSEPIDKQLTFDELKPHLHQHENLSDAIPYRTSYYKRDWGFCVTQKQYQKIQKAKNPLQVVIDSKFDPNGSMVVGELLIPGESEEEILISTYFCHPSLANDNLTGTVMTAFLARELLNTSKRQRSYRIIWVPETIGAIAYCASNESAMKKIKSGLVVTSVGGPGKFGYKQSHNSDHSINAIIEETFSERKIDYISYPFDIHGSDERQYSSQGFRINMASITKDKYYEYPYYHSSLDNLDFVKPESIIESLSLHKDVLEKINTEVIYQTRHRECEVMLSKHDLYPKTGAAQIPTQNHLSDLDLTLWILWLCDGQLGLYGIAKKLGVPLERITKIIGTLESRQLIERIS